MSEHLEDCANPLLATWLKEWMDEAKERNARSYTVFVNCSTTVVSPDYFTVTRKPTNPLKHVPLNFNILPRPNNSMASVQSYVTV